MARMRIPNKRPKKNRPLSSTAVPKSVIDITGKNKGTLNVNRVNDMGRKVKAEKLNKSGVFDKSVVKYVQKNSGIAEDSYTEWLYDDPAISRHLRKSTYKDTDGTEFSRYITKQSIDLKAGKIIIDDFENDNNYVAVVNAEEYKEAKRRWAEETAKVAKKYEKVGKYALFNQARKEIEDQGKRMQSVYDIANKPYIDSQGRAMQGLYGVGTTQLTKNPTFVKQNRSPWALPTKSQSFKQSLITKCINRGADMELINRLEALDADKIMEMFNMGLFGEIEQYFDYGDDYDDSQGFVSKIGNADAIEIIEKYEAYYGTD